MTRLSNLFTTYSPRPSSKKIATAEGSLVTVAGIGNVKINPSMKLKNVHHVPKLSTNLISVKKLCKDLLCKVIFDTDNCIFQEKDSGRTIGSAKERDDLYYLEESNGSDTFKSKPPYSFSSESVLSNNKKMFFYITIG